MNCLLSIVIRLYAASDSLKPEGIKILILIYAKDRFNRIMCSFIILNVPALSNRNSVDSFQNSKPCTAET